ncbi:MAG: polysaccharide biosynthesis tyrosine autokinase [Pirellulales bacterium]|nr:polysaccharide biosynthesis tyrosine autokinase [Pirellulales bacterium]
MTALWRYRWAVVLPAAAASLVAFLMYSQTPETYESSSKLLIESSHPAMLDQVTGDVLGGVPDVGIIQSQLFSDRVLSLAYDAPRMRAFRDELEEKQFFGIAHSSLSLIPGGSGTQSQVMVLRFKNQDAELCEAAVKSFSESLQQLFDERQKSSRAELIRLITAATEQIKPEIDKLEDAYGEFRREAPLVWNEEGVAINPHRERQLYLVQRRSELAEKLGQKNIELAAVESVMKNSKDYNVAINVVSKLLDVEISVPSITATQENLREVDAQLAELELDERLVPLMIERNKYAAQFGEEHPSVKQLDSELTLMKSELKRIVLQQSERIVELMNENKQEALDPQALAAEAVNTIVYASRAEIDLLKNKLQELDDQINIEKEGAIKLAKYEQENNAMLRQIAHNRTLLNQLQEQWTRVNLTEEEGGTRVIELTAPTVAYRVGPDLVKFLATGGFLGLAIGAALAFLLEKNANTFRDPDEVSEMLGIPVLTHLPFFKARTRKVKKGEIDPFAKLDSSLSVVHQPASVAAEAIRSVRTSIMFELSGGGKVIQVTSPLPGDGKSTIAGNLACSLAQSGKRVLAIDCDLRRPQLTDNFSLANANGLTNVLNGECEPHEAAHQSPLNTLHVMPSGPIPTNPAEALTLPEMAELLNLLRDQYDYIILDTPPLLVVTDPSITASMVDGVLLALRIRRKSKPNAKESTNILRAVGARILGIVINNSDESGTSDGYRGYGYYRYGRYTSRYYRASNSNNGSNVPAGNSSPMVVSGRGVAKVAKIEQPDTFGAAGDQQLTGSLNDSLD